MASRGNWRPSRRLTWIEGEEDKEAFRFNQQNHSADFLNKRRSASKHPACFLALSLHLSIIMSGDSTPQDSTLPLVKIISTLLTSSNVWANPLGLHVSSPPFRLGKSTPPVNFVGPRLICIQSSSCNSVLFNPRNETRQFENYMQPLVSCRNTPLFTFSPLLNKYDLYTKNECESPASRTKHIQFEQLRWTSMVEEWYFSRCPSTSGNLQSIYRRFKLDFCWNSRKGRKMPWSRRTCWPSLERTNLINSLNTGSIPL